MDNHVIKFKNEVSEPVLFLNYHYNPYKMITGIEAVWELFTGKVDVLDSSDGRTRYNFEEWEAISNDFYDELKDKHIFLHTSRSRVAVPHMVVSSKRGTTRARKVNWNRESLKVRDRLTCGYCGTKLKHDEVHIDHIFPKERGGKLTYPNTVCACWTCNQKKRNRTPEEAGMKLLWKPTIPADLRFRSEYHKIVRNHNPYWNQYLREEDVA